MFLASKDFTGGRIVIREHEFGMSRSILLWDGEAQKWRTVSHTVKLFQEAG